MPVVDPAAFERRLRSLDAAALAAFVADLWAARGYETTVDGTTVLARDPARDRREVIQCLGGRFGRRAIGGDADVVVSTRPIRVDGPDDARVVRPDELRSMLLYAIDRETAGRLSVTHFGRPLTVDERGSRLREHLAALPRRARLAGVALVVVAGVLALAVWGLGGPTGSADPARLAEPAATPAAVGTPEFDRPSDGGSLFRYPPGIGPSGVTDASALAAAHRDEVAQSPWDLLIVHYGTMDPIHPDRQWVGSRQTVDRSTPSRYWYRVTGLERTGPDTFASVIYDDYADGDENYRRVADGPDPEYRRTRLPTAGSDGVFTAVASAYVERYLATSEGRVETVEFGLETRYRVVASGTPREIDGPVSNYTAVAIVDRQGLVYRLSVQYDRPDRQDATTATPPTIGTTGLAPPTTPGAVRFSLVYRDIGEATVPTPSWYEEARNATEGSDLGPWPNDPSV